MELPDLSHDIINDLMMATDQRTKSRLRAKRLYYKKRNVREKLLQEVDVLKEEYEHLVTSYCQQDAQRTSETTVYDSNWVLRHAYVQLIQMKTALVYENKELKRLHCVNMEMERQMKQLIAAQEKEVQVAKQKEEYKQRNPVFKINPLTQDMCEKIAQTSYLEIKAFRENDACSFSTGACVLGWRDRHVMRGNKLMFSLEKTFQGRAMDWMSRNIWEILSLPEPIVIMRPRDAKTHFHVVQRLNEDAVVYYYTLERENTDVRIRAFILAMRVDLGSEGCMVILRNLDPKTYLQHDGDCTAPVRRGRRKIEPHKENFWLDVFVWSFYEHAGEKLNDCKQTFGGEIEGTSLASTGWWSIEILEMALRMETRGNESQGLLRW